MLKSGDLCLNMVLNLNILKMGLAFMICKTLYTVCIADQTDHFGTRLIISPMLKFVKKLRIYRIATGLIIKVVISTCIINIVIIFLSYPNGYVH